jgi:predicted HTH domain antitoxin
MTLTVNNTFADVLEPLGQDAANFFLAASLYHAHKVSFETAAKLAGLGLEGFQSRLHEHFGVGFLLADEVALQDIQTVGKL